MIILIKCLAFHQSKANPLNIVKLLNVSKCHYNPVYLLALHVYYKDNSHFNKRKKNNVNFLKLSMIRGLLKIKSLLQKLAPKSCQGTESFRF